MIDWIIMILLGVYVALQARINRYLDAQTIDLRAEVERVKNRMRVYEHKQQVTDTAVDMLYVDKYGPVELEVRH